MSPGVLLVRSSEDKMCKVLIADDSKVMRTAIRKALEEEIGIHVVGEAASFGQAMQLVSDLKPDILLLDLHMPEEQKVAPELVKNQLGTVKTIAVSFSNDSDAQALAKRYGAITLLDKMTLYTEMIPAIRQCHPEFVNLQKPPTQPTPAA
jgi:DNA-binding NarL/FixJ family response regulator